MIVGDDLIATNPKRLQTAIDKKAATALIIKPNQIGTLTETMEVVQMAQRANFKVIVSHRSGETNDDFIADFGVQLKQIMLNSALLHVVNVWQNIIDS